MLRRIELEVLAIVERGDTISELATKLDYSGSYLSRAVTDLVEKGLLYTERDGRRKRVVPSDARAVEIYQDLVRQHSHIDFSELLTGKTLEVLYYLDQPRTVADLAARTDNYRNTVNRVLKRLRNRGLVGTTDSQYQFNGDFDRLHEFARELAHRLHRRRLESVAPNGTILWEDHGEFLAQTQTEVDAEGFHETGLVRFAAFDLQFLLTSHRYYVFSEDLGSVLPAELCCHTLLIDDDTRHRSYCLLLLSHVDVDEQRRQQKELSELKTRFETFAQTVSEALFLLPVDYSETLYVNDAVERIYGVTPQEAYEDPTVWLQHIHPDDREALRAAMDHFQEGRITGRVSQRYRIQHPDRGLRWVETEMDVVTDNSGTATQIAGITRDITNLKERDQVLEETAQRLTVALEGTNTGVWEWDLETDEVIWTESMENLFGVTPGTFEGTYDAFAEHVHPDDLPALEESIQKALDNTEPLQAEYRILTDDDREIWGEVRAELVEREDTSQKIVGIVTDITKRKQNERELKRTRELIEKTQENASIGWWEVDLTEETVHWSDEVYRIHDVPLDEEIALDDGINFYHPEAKPIIRDAFEKVTTDGEPYDLELQIVTATDQVRWVRTVGDPLYSDNGDITGVLGIFQDITERKQREETLRQFREAIERTAHAVYITDTDGIIEYVNPAFEEITGFTADEAIGQTPRIFYSGKHDSNYYEKFWETIETGSQWESEMVNTRADGKEIILNQTVAPILNDDGVPEKYVVIARDITERKQYEQKLKDARKNLRDVIDLIPDIIALKDKDGRYLLANQTTAETYGITVEELEGTLEKDIIPSPEEAEKFRQDDLEVIESGEPKHIPEEELTTANGETKILQTTKIPYKTNGGGTDAVLLYARDITALKQYEQQLETQRDNLDLLNQVVRHDIRNDLQLIQAYGGMLAEVDSLSEQQQLFISKVLKAANNAVDLTTSARDLSEVMLRDETETKPMPLAQTVEQQVDRLQSETQSAIVTVDGSLPAVDVIADELLEAIFRNLLKNAVQHNDKDVPEITVSASVDNHQVIVNVADNGSGVSDAHKTEIFGRGNQGLKSEGTGIGLYLVQTLVDRYGGTVWVEDNDPDGAVFAVELQVDS